MHKSTQTTKSTQAFLCCYCDRLVPLCAVDLDALHISTAVDAECVHCGTAHTVCYDSDSIRAELI